MKNKPLRGTQGYHISLVDQDIVNAYKVVMNSIQHTDAPTEEELCVIRSHLPITHPEMISLHWLRNRVVALRKADWLPTQG